MTPLDKIFTASKMLFNNMPFYGILSLRVRKVLDEQTPTAHIQLGKDNFAMEMHFNPKFVDELTVEEVRGLIEHELSHMINGHLTDPMYINESVLQEAMNIACDCEINQYILPKYLPKDGLTLESVSNIVGTSLPSKAGSKTYYDLLMNLVQKHAIKITLNEDGTATVSGNGGEKTTVDVHVKMDPKHNSATQAAIEGIVESAADETIKRRGTLPASVESLLKSIQEKRKPVIDWKSFLRRFVQNSYKEYCITTRRRESRRFDENPGLRHEPEFSLLVGIDSSGSVSDSELKEFMNEIDNIYKNKCDIRILVCDTKIVQDFQFKGLKEQITINGRGGTSFEPVLEAYEKSKDTCLVYFTDGECPLERKLKKPVLWVISSRGTTSYLKDCKTIKMEK